MRGVEYISKSRCEGYELEVKMWEKEEEEGGRKKTGVFNTQSCLGNTHDFSHTLATRSTR